MLQRGPRRCRIEPPVSRDLGYDTGPEFMDTPLSNPTQQQHFQDFANRYQQGAPDQGYSN